MNDRIIIISLNTKPVKTHLIQAYFPTSDAPDQDIEDMYGLIEELMEKIASRDITIILGDFNAKVGATKTDDHSRSIVGKFGLGTRNERGERLMQFATDNSLTILNTLFQHHARRLSTWTSPDKKTKNQIDYLLVNKRWRSSFRNVKTKPSAECGSDHRLLIADFRIKLQRLIKPDNNKRKVNTHQPMTFQQALSELPQPGDHNDPNQLWEETKTWIELAVAKCQKQEAKQIRKHWMTGKTLELVEQRRNAKLSNTDPIETAIITRQLNKQIKTESRKDKNQYIHNICIEIENHANQNNTHDLYNRVKYLSRDFKPKTQIIQDDQGNIITDLKGIAEVWKNYCTKLYHDNPTTCLESENRQYEMEPGILKTEVEKAIGKLGDRKAPGPDNINAETIKAMGEAGINIMHTICQCIWTSGKWPEEWAKSLLIPIYKKGSPAD